MPEITVLMPVRNGEKYIKNAIDSVLNQTLTDFEFLIIDDGSTDRTVKIIQDYADERIHLVKRKHQFIQNLNEGLQLASGAYIARMDADDIMHTERLRIQLKRMKKIRISQFVVHGLRFSAIRATKEKFLILDMELYMNLYWSY
ncbi:glycosyltransferase [Bacteroides faecis]|uniref:glycosyltransferase family 2 protein n=1 Tax=Bacteroides faecis TaxID=674529 RepID=UPI002164A5F6|nr:glycosyltransferase family 2 protein [Bacteroides faecis]MCS2195960.1 glycosyltransferase [Bacteroides faecis]MCS2651729.1 glycosyltransferase [Bacteroides faecis]MCS3303385.1 glycosyltransferase [Bacteroides faecis]UVQ61592.1 glycosyltransferase [Bacteroides faecis]UVS36657.1 glycosyltransferase [Bacteroides faecis]